MIKNSDCGIYLFIHRFPEIPYFILGTLYLLTQEKTVSLHVFSAAFLYLITSLAVGLLLKSFFRTKRPIKHYNLPALRYDFPSLHSMVSAGAAVFAYYIEPSYSILLAPICFIYLYSRIKLKAHTLFGVIGGGLLGAVLGLIFGLSLSRLHLPWILELSFSMMLFCSPVITSIFRKKYSKKIV